LLSKTKRKGKREGKGREKEGKRKEFNKGKSI